MPSWGSEIRLKAAARQGLSLASWEESKITVPATEDKPITSYCYRFAFP
ncbi:hypothetical protein [Xenorhabdus sp. PB30.3]|nr:hypothetical protein [Xenorhabdus sp. PB30.3]